MPGLVVFRRRWSVGSDDLVVPGAFLLLIHIVCFVIVSVALLVFPYDTTVLSTKLLWYHQVGYVVILMLSICTEAGICVVSMRGSILDSGVRTTINLWIYIKSLIIFFDITWLVLGTIWLVNYYIESPVDQEKKLFIAIIICNWTLLFITIITIWCTFDAAGRSWVKMKKYQRSMRETESRFNYKRSNSMNRNWRQRKVMRAYQDSWDHRCRLLFCCMGSSERNRNSFTDIARLLSDFFRELDVVPSDVVAGLVLLRKFQKLEREAIVRQKKNGTYEFLSGVPITERTQFLALNDTKNYDFFQTVIHYMYFAQGAYGWPMYFIINRSKMWHLVPEMKCFGCCCGHGDESEIIQDNCCYCNYAALKKTLQVGDTEITYVTYHVDVGETPFFVAIDYSQRKVVVSIRGTLSMKDILTDLNAEGDVLPLDPPRDDWLGHKGMVQAAIYIKNKLIEENLIEKALNRNPDRNTHTFGLVLVGHSLGAGTAAILAILMKPKYPSLQCFSYSPPGGLLSMPAVEYSKSFITSVVLGKDVVPRIGLYQMEALRADLINAIQRSVDPKWKTISCSVICCGCGPEPTSVVEMSEKETHITQYQKQRDTARSTSSHPTDSSIALTLHQPLYPPGRIIHIVRHHPKPEENVLKSREPVYQAIWAESTDFDEVLISPVMLQDHMPDQVLAALKKVVTASGPRKPQRQSSNAFSTASNDVNFNYADPISIIPNHRSCSNLSQTGTLSPTTHHKVCLETSFTNLQSPLDVYSYQGSSKASSVADSIAGRTYLSSAQHEISSIIEDSITVVTRRSPSALSETATVVTNDHGAQFHLGAAVNGSHHRLKAVAFDMDTSSAAITHTPSPQMPTRSILHRQFSVRDACKPKTLPFPPLRRASDVDDSAKIIHDDWLGLAPLASPETLSEISSISSRTPSAPISLANSIERYLHNLTSVKDNEHKQLLEDIFESQLHTPKVMRRAPKFSENLSTCADNSKNLDQYKRMGRVFITFPQILPSQDSSVDSSDESFESAQSLSRIQHDNLVRRKDCVINSRNHRQSSMSADQLKDDTQETLNGGIGGGSGVASLNTKLTFSDSQILNDNCISSCPNCPCRRCDNSANATCCLKTNHTNCSSTLSQAHLSDAQVTGSKETTFYSANSSVEQFLTPRKSPPSKFSPLPKPNESIRPGVLESHFPVITTIDGTSSEYLTKMTNNQNVVGGRVRKRLSSEEFIYSSSEEPSSIVQILDNYVGSSSCNSSNGRKRKGCVYPASNNSIRISTQTVTQFHSDSPKRQESKKGLESSV